MKQILLIFALLASWLQTNAQQWVKMDLTKAEGGVISNKVYQLASKNNKLYAATDNGIYVSASGNGADWVAYGLQGKKVYLLNFEILQLAMTIETAADDATKLTLQLYKYNGADWINTGFNPDKLKVFGDYPHNLTNFAQLQNNNEVAIALPTWGNGIWISQNSGANWSQVPFVEHPSNGYHFYRKIPGVFSFPGDNTIYALDKADFGMQYLSYSTDFGQNWQYKEVDNFFNPWALYKRNYKGANYMYYGGERGENGFLYRKTEGSTSWDASITLGDGGLHNRRMLEDKNGKLYLMAGRGTVYMSNDNGETFEIFGTGIPRPQTTKNFFLTHLIEANNKLVLSTEDEGVYSIELNTTQVNEVNEKAIYLFNRDTKTLQLTTMMNDKIQLYNLSGVLMYEQIAAGNNTSIQTVHLPTSIYILKIKSNDSTVKTNRFFNY